MEYILKGDPKEVAKVIQENRIRADRGVIVFAPCEPETALDADAISTLQEECVIRGEQCRRMAECQHELAELARTVVVIAVESGAVIPEDTAAKLADYGVDVPKSVPENEETVENDGDSVPENEENVPMPEDSKSVDCDDMTEVNLDDVKDALEEDVKPEPTPTPKKKRSPKSE